MKPQATVPDREFYCDEFSRDQHYSQRRPHGSGDWLLIYTAGGAGRIVTKNGELITGTGDVIIYAPDDEQDYSTSSEAGHWRLLWVHFLPRPHWLVWLRWPQTKSGVKRLHLEDEVRTEFQSAMKRMIWLSRRKVPGAFDLAANALEAALLWVNVAASKGPWLTMDSRVRKAVDHLATHLTEPFQLENLARNCATSVSRLAHLFKAETGLSPQQFHERQRLLHASQLLRLTNLSIAEIAAEIGYKDPFYFSNRFRRHAGKSPSSFRELGKVPLPAADRGPQARFL